MAYYGIDKESYPGITAMKNFYNSGLFSYTGFYLPGTPFHSDTSFNAQARADIASIGYGFMIYYVGRQTSSAATLKTRSQGAADAASAIAKAKACGFTRGIIYLDIEGDVKGDTAMLEYAAGFMVAFQDTAFQGGIYCSTTSANYLNSVPYVTRFIVARYDSSLNNTYSGITPANSGISFASTWQYAGNVTKTFNGSTLKVDLNVSDYRNPSET
ncbi:glycoside hydrolase domain-containing protein [Paenibacillus sp. sgz5001063]|uniref:glycoside hydrolase domain-containing protein n=1 Tax=Paenibacillus sp. sgz5001063 TaxID=3242474 RepID=UPI0036D41C07